MAGTVLAIDPDEARANELRALRAVAAGDQAAFAQLVAAHGPALLRFARSVLSDLAEAEDVVQESLLKLWEAAATWTQQARLSTWLHTVCYNRAVDRLRARRGFVEISELENQADEAVAADGAMIRAEQAAGLRMAMEALPHRQLTAVTLFHLQELSQSDCAAVMGISESAFESLLARARRRLRAALSEGDRLEDTHDG